MVHHRTILRGGGHSRQTITRSKKATVIHQSMTHMGSSSGSEYRASGSILNRANSTCRVGCGRNLYSTSSTAKSGSSSEEKPQIYISGEYKSTQQVQPHPRRGQHIYAQDNSRLRLRFLCSKARFYTCRGLFLQRVFLKQFLT